MSLEQLKAEVQANLANEPERADAVTGPELRALLHLDRATFYRWQRIGKFRRLELNLGTGVRRRYSRRKVMALLDGAPITPRRTA